MENVYRLRPVNWIRELGLPIISLTLLVALAWVTAGESAIQKSIITLFLLGAGFHLVIMLRLGNAMHLIPFVFYLSGSLTLMSIPFKVSTATSVFTLFSMIFFLLFMWVLIRRKIKWRYREVLELAARSVRSIEDGYTTRPFNVGNLKLKKDDVTEFAMFLCKHGIVWPVSEGDSLVLVVPDTMFSFLFGLKREYHEETYVRLEKTGEVSVRISKRAYRQYQEELTFDQLCSALGDLFGTFYDYWSKGKKYEIINMMDELNLIT